MIENGVEICFLPVVSCYLLPSIAKEAGKKQIASSKKQLYPKLNKKMLLL